MEFVVSIDERGRILLPSELRRRLGFRKGDKVVIKVRDEGVIELYLLSRLYSKVSSVFEEKFKNWREVDHEASKLLFKMVGSLENG
ncbi:MAG: AbrB family transcriptional regulator [Thermoprotei archaeon]|nr:MAG: AbrB family transcriptional regulator [Thermoprotei archaeon]